MILDEDKKMVTKWRFHSWINNVSLMCIIIQLIYKQPCIHKEAPKDFIKQYCVHNTVNKKRDTQKITKQIWVLKNLK